MSSFGDFDPDDAYAPGPVDIEAVARHLWDDLHRLAPRVFKAFDAHRAADRAPILDAIGLLLARLHDEGVEP
jgi:thymidylate synthase ThyX